MMNAFFRIPPRPLFTGGLHFDAVFDSVSLNNPEINQSFMDYSNVGFGKAFNPRI
jgi:hypothetical protein